MRRIVACATCTGPFETTVRTRKYCSALCRSRRDNRRKRIPTDADRARWAARGKRPQGSTIARGYGPEHKAKREQWRPRVERGEVQCHAVLCVHLSRWIAPGTAWDLGHNAERTAWTGPEHKRCNRRDGAVRGNRRRGHAEIQPALTSRRW